MTVLRYTCTACGIVTRVEDGQDYRVCVCRAPYDLVNEDEEAAMPPVDPPEAT
jgi:hypothetical protein